MESASVKESKILLLGTTGAGKSTFINRLTNHFKGGDPQNLKIAIPTKYLGATENVTHSEKDIKNQKKSQTKECQAYSFTDPTDHINKFIFIDTPGLSDVDGIERDKENIEKIIKIVIDAKRLSGIAIVVNGTDVRLTSTMQNTLAQLSNNLPDNFLDNNLLMILTKCNKHNANFNPGDFFAKPKEVFYMDNSAFHSDPKTWEEDTLIYIKADWKISKKSIESLLDTIKKMPPKQTTSFNEMQTKKNIIKMEIEKLSQSIDTIRLIQDKLDEHHEVMKNASDIKEFLNFIENETIYVKKFVKVGYKNTYCFDHMYDGMICHHNCGVEYNNQDTNDLRKCICLSEGELCKTCGCGPERHFQSDEELQYELPSNIAEELKALLNDEKYFKKVTENYFNRKSDAKVAEDDLNELDSEIENLYHCICQRCHELRKICTHFNFAIELQANIDNMKKCTKKIKNLERKEKTMNFIAKLEQFIYDQSKNM
ncbi:9610_t:CDS:2 [Gigaspora margarita]|uniref:9610_t:CDS:1 n=1 Tax=Gigaspora margarita TaxID=4874 RepID=A0ABN7U8V6_GIGMA|nr:9610_t:CDS:2 [Gigaspora margarita]